MLACTRSRSPTAACMRPPPRPHSLTACPHSPRCPPAGGHAHGCTQTGTGKHPTPALLCRPQPVPIGGDREDADVAAAYLQDEQAVQALERHYQVHVEEAGGQALQNARKPAENPPASRPPSPPGLDPVTLASP